MQKSSLALIAVLAVVQPGWTQDCPKCKSCGNETYETSIQWEGSPSEAATRAKKEEKLVFVLHVSGNFADPKFT